MYGKDTKPQLVSRCHKFGERDDYSKSGLVLFLLQGTRTEDMGRGGTEDGAMFCRGEWQILVRRG